MKYVFLCLIHKKETSQFITFSLKNVNFDPDGKSIFKYARLREEKKS